MLTDELFRRTIQDSPDDDGPRLVCADWLEERGECDRAELIRLQCLSGDCERIRELVTNHGSIWGGPVARHAYSFAFRRGFIEEITIAGSTLLEHWVELFDFAPVRLLRVIGARSVLSRLVESPLLARLEALHITGGHLGDDGAEQIAGCPHLGGLRALRLGGNAIGDRGLEALADSSYFANLHALVLHANLIGDVGAQILASARGLRRLRCLDLSDNLIGDAGADALARGPGFDHLTYLDMSNQFKGWSTGLTFRGRPYPIQPRQQTALTDRYGTATCVF